MDIDQLAHQLFNSEPKAPHSIQIEFEGFGTEELFKSLCLLFTQGMKKFYGDKDGKVNISEISQVDIDKVNEYFKSIGLVFFINNVTHERKSELSEHQLNMKSGEWKGELFFDYLKTS